MKAAELKPEQVIDVGEKGASVPVTVVAAEVDGLNPFRMLVLTLELRYRLSIPVDENVRLVRP